MNASPVAVQSRPFLIDTDVSFDDYVALLYLLHHPAVDVRAITVANGVVHVEPGLENMRRLLALVARDDIPLAAGPPMPLSPSRGFPRSWRLWLDYGPRILLPLRKVAAASISAPELIRREILASETPVTFVALAPLTNLALALRRDPALASRIERVVISGGAIHVPGTIHEDDRSNPNEVAEWNLYLDAAAAELVFRSGVPISLIPMDVTHFEGERPLLFYREFVKRLSRAARGKGPRLLARFLRLWRMVALHYRITPVWDGVVAALATHPEIGCDWRELKLRVVTEPDEVAGQTVIDPAQGSPVRACLGGDQTAFEAAYLDVVRGRKGA